MRNRSSVLVVVLSILFVGAAGAAHAEEVFDPERPQGTYIQVDLPDDGTAETHSSSIIFLNACWGGCTITRGSENSRTNTSSIVSGTVNIAQFDAGQSTWDAVVQCVTEMYEPFGITITDVDPGNASHFESITAGRPQDIGAGSGVGGVAPFGCGVINNAITFTFANIYGGSVRSICEVVAQETAHAFGLDHEYHCPDPMTYLFGCGNKEFRDINAQCGEGSARQCQCGGSTQNSFQKILSIFGPGTPTPPSVTITEPTQNGEVVSGFVVRADITDNVDVVRAELWIDNQRVGGVDNPPWVFNAPATLGDGIHNVEVRATDNQNTVGSDGVQVILGEPCKKASDCSTGEVCIEGRCVVGPGNACGLGETCETNDDCCSGSCASDGTDSVCVEECDVSCPSGFGCIAAGDTSICWPGAKDDNDSGGGCSTTGGNGSLPITLALAFGLIVFGRRRRW